MFSLVAILAPLEQRCQVWQTQVPPQVFLHSTVQSTEALAAKTWTPATTAKLAFPRTFCVGTRSTSRQDDLIRRRWKLVFCNVVCCHFKGTSDVCGRQPVQDAVQATELDRAFSWLDRHFRGTGGCPCRPGTEAFDGRVANLDPAGPSIVATGHSAGMLASGTDVSACGEAMTSHLPVYPLSGCTSIMGNARRQSAMGRFSAWNLSRLSRWYHTFT